ncbi:hypothetical protein FXF51_29810 [Nonomuraea sp. PA05]|uniref:hypothetical protein n=1 Tax=Nonomuraea sp. PA05 TaxID=2604466 RepID=UPI0011DB383F|nr:hypothetical protein [Nonomuraea sp. PA05]TYB61040.1 hypothetical protein FXF51_29810 [Nonomuraea sp. PA05]
MPHGDDLDQRFNELVAQIDAEQRRKMRDAAKKAARESRRARGGDAGRLRRDERSAAWERPGWDSTVWDATPAAPRPRPRRRAGRAWLVLAGLTAVLTAASAVVALRPDLLVPSGAVPEETMPVAAPLPSQAEAGPVPEETQPVQEGPFAGSPAEEWAEGIDGFVMPEAKAIGGLSKKDVAKGLERARDLLAAAHLNHKTIMGGEPEAFMKLLHPEERARFSKDLGDSSRTWVTSFAPKTAELTSEVIKVHGTAKLSSFKEKGRTGAELETNHLIGYAVRRPGQPGTALRLVTQRWGTLHMYREAGELVVWITRWRRSATPARCDVNDGYIHPFYADSAPGTVAPTGVPADPYALNAPGSSECGASAGT